MAHKRLVIAMLDSYLPYSSHIPGIGLMDPYGIGTSTYIGTLR